MNQGEYKTSELVSVYLTQKQMLRRLKALNGSKRCFGCSESDGTPSASKAQLASKHVPGVV